jgi:D-sedoheptulose 7-phosphate isomerase
MKPDVLDTPHDYLVGFGRMLERIELTGRAGDPLPGDLGITSIIDLIVTMRELGKKVMLIGNGGSAAIVSHIHNDLCKSVGLRAVVFNESPLLTAIANDDGYHEVFARPVSLWADKGDLLIAVSSSGESENIVKAAALAQNSGCRLVTFTGFKPGNRLRQMGDVNVYVPIANYGYVEMAHSVVAHYVTDQATMRIAASV